MRWKLISISALLGVLWFVAYPGSSSPRTTTTPNVEAAATYTELHTSALHAVDPRAPDRDQIMQQLSYKIDQLTLRMEQLEARPQPEPDAPAEQHAATSVPSPPSWSEHLEQLQQSFEAEHRDPTWSTKNASEIRTLIQSLPKLDSALRSLDCRSQHCRVELIQNSSSEFAEAAMVLNMKLASTLPTAEYQYVDRGHGDRSVVVYYSELVHQAEHSSM